MIFVQIKRRVGDHKHSREADVEGHVCVGSEGFMSPQQTPRSGAGFVFRGIR